MFKGWKTLWIRFAILGVLLVLASFADHVRPVQASDRPTGTVFVLSAPSGTGKSTLAKALALQVPDLIFAVSHTTRPPRPGERDGVDYAFVDDATFDTLQSHGRFIESVEIYGHRYGLSRDWLEQNLGAGKDILLDLDTDGARSIRQAIPQAVSIFLLPPSSQELARRLRSRGTETEDQLSLRMGKAKEELARFPEYDYLVVNQTVAQATREVEAIILAARARQERKHAIAQKILGGF